MLKKIRVNQLVMGMHIHELCGSWMEHPFWRSNFLLSDEKDLHTLRTSSIQEVWIDTSKGGDVPSGTKVVNASENKARVEQRIQQAAAKPVKPESTPISDELSRAAKICAHSKEAVTSMFEDARMGKAVDSAQARVLVEEISESVNRNSAALLSLARLKTADDYTYMHSVAVCALMMALGRQLNLNTDQLRQAGMAGLLHDLGKAKMPSEVLNKPGKLTDEEFAIMKRHPAEGHRMLLKVAKSIGAVTLDVCLHHHEKTNGSGYPERLNDSKISLFAKMGAVCDVYDAITSNRPYKEGWDPAESLRKMAEWADGHFDQRIFQAFVKSLGIYPVGSLVRLESGKLAVVLEQSRGSLLKPKVKAFYSTRSRARIAPKVIDLSGAGATESIAGREDPAEWDFSDLNELWSGMQGAPA
ncbi:MULTISPECIES: HD-GYP domain-containing protein [Thiorhodovibrio]|uniref:HD-GYP domain-containing protein n=1 Tax=Thiorhodovibrio TaxID=61593 RepID=UPI0019142FAA|nr:MULTISPECIES: HD-GYP domain-containing protein [Thiorhodovibrio]MBK5970066.1 phosphodiesterase [Thiorhodovibrio winogradskyi]WPL12992.1 Cyclic di-GMP phosphodiesterase response regulator RpfG [Thiorhodovibrio litoralis]